MKKYLTIILVVLVSEFVMCQTSTRSFHSNINNGYQGFTQSQIDTFISKADLESYRLQDKRVTLSFDNGFDVELLSANEMAQLGLINNAHNYPLATSGKKKLPVFQMAPNGWITAQYSANPKAVHKSINKAR